MEIHQSLHTLKTWPAEMTVLQITNQKRRTLCYNMVSCSLLKGGNVGIVELFGTCAFK